MSHDTASLRHQLLIAMPSLNEGIFARSVIYLCEHSPEGTMGLILNRPLDITLQTVFDQLKLPCPSDRQTDPVFAGGPVATERGFVLHLNDGREWESSLALSDSVCLTTSADILDAIGHGAAPAQWQLLLGYAGWSAGQLEEELLENAWLTLPCPSERWLLDTPWEQQLEQAVAQLGIHYHDLAGVAGHG